MLSKNDITWKQPVRTCMLPNQKVNKAEELTFLSTNIALTIPPHPLTPAGMKVPAMDKLKLTGLNLGQVLNYRCGRASM